MQKLKTWFLSLKWWGKAGLILIVLAIFRFIVSGGVEGRYKIDAAKSSSRYVSEASLKEMDTYFEFNSDKTCRYYSSALGYNIDRHGTYIHNTNNDDNRFTVQWSDGQGPYFIHLKRTAGGYEFKIDGTFYTNSD